MRPATRGIAVTIGAYDGVHLGHRALLAELQTRAEPRTGWRTVVVTFDRHPATVVRPESAPKLLCDLDQKLELLEAVGVDRTVVVTFDEERANETAEEFVSEVLVDGLDARLVVVGEDFHFGHGRKGNVALLRRDGGRGRVRGRRRIPAARTCRDGGAPAEPISSTRVRTLVAEGRVEEAADLLGRAPPGPGPGRAAATAGVAPSSASRPPTSTSPRSICLPGDGHLRRVVRTTATGRRWEAAISVGRRPTFYGSDGRAAGRGVPARLLRRPLRRGGAGLLRRPAA